MTDPALDTTTQAATDASGPALEGEDFVTAAKAAAAATRTDVSHDAGEGASSLTDDAPGAPANDNASGAAEADDDPDAPAIAKRLRARMANQKERSEAEAYAERRRREADDYAARVQAEADRRVQDALRRVEEEGRRRIEELTSPEAIHARQADQNDPNLRLRKWFEQELGKRDKQLEDVANYLRTSEQRAREYHETSAQQDFKQRATAKAAPHLHAMWEGDTDAMLAFAQAEVARIKRKYAEKGEDFSCTNQELLELLEYRARRAARLQQAGESAGPEKGSPPRSTGAQSRTLSTQHASERRTSPKPPEEMTDKELEKAMKDVARKVLRKED